MGVLGIDEALAVLGQCRERKQIMAVFARPPRLERVRTDPFDLFEQRAYMRPQSWQTPLL